MPDATPAGPYSTAVDGLCSLISNVPFFQTWTGTASAAAAALRVFVGDVGCVIASIAVSSHVVTVVTREVHGFSVADVVTLEGASIGAESDLNLAGAKTIASVPSATSFTFAQSLADDTLTPNDAVVMPARPYAVAVDASDGLKGMAIATGGATNFNGACELLIEAAVSSGYVNDARNATVEAQNALGQLMQGILDLADGDYLIVSRVEVESMPQFISRPEQNDNTKRFERWQALLKIYWGLDS